MMRLTCLVATLCICLATAPLALGAAEAEKAAEAFESLYGEDVKRVRATRDAADDLALAKRLLKDADLAHGQPEFLAVLCEKACDLAGATAEGADTAVEAMDLLAAEVPEKAGACAERIAEIRQRLFDRSRGEARAEAGEALIDALLGAAEAKASEGDYAGAAALARRAQTVARAVKSDRKDEIETLLTRLAADLRTEREIEGLKALIEKDAANAAARDKLVRLFLVERDDPKAAAKWVEGVQDEDLRKYVPAAAKDVAQAPELACLELGDWYRGLGDTAAPEAKAAMYVRAQGYYERFLALHSGGDLKRTAAVLALGKLKAALEEAGSAAAARTAYGKGKWIDLLKLVDPAKHAVKGKWERQDGGLAALSDEMGQRTMLPVKIAGSYELAVEFTRTSGRDNVAIHVPVGSSNATLTLNAHGSLACLEMLQGKVDGDKTAVEIGALQNGREYRVHVKVVPQDDQARVVASLDGKPLIDWSGPQSALSRNANWRLPEDGCPGLGTWLSTAVFHSVQMRVLSGEAKVLRPEGGGKTTPGPKPKSATGETLKPGQRTDLLSRVDLPKHAVSGDWEKKDGGLALTNAPGGGRVMIPAAPAGSYELKVTCTRTWGDSTIAIILPVGSTGVVVSLDYMHGSAGGLDSVNGEPPDKNETRVKAVNMGGGRSHVVHAKVQTADRAAQIDVTVDGDPHIAWRGPLAALAVPKQWKLPSDEFIGFGAWYSRAVLERVRLKMLSGEAKVPRP